jgi:hypothetical protein
MRVWLAAGLIVMAGVQVAAQSQRLGDIADGIRLDRDGETVIDERVVATVPQRTRSGGLDRAQHELASCRDLGRQLLTTLRRSVVRDLFLDAEWREEVRSVSRDLVVCVDLLDSVGVPGEATGLWLEAIGAAESYLELTERMERLLVTDTPDYRPVLDGLERTNSALDTFIGRLATTERWMDRSAASAPPTGAEVTEIVSSRCGIFPAESADRRICADRQRRAAEVLGARTRYSAGVDEAVFNAVRNRCGELHPADLVERERCERIQLAAGSSRTGP